MPYKIVKTIERGKPQLCIVPSQWENGGLLKWPKKGAEKLARDQSSIPGHDWLKIKCSVKRSYYPTYTAAEAELKIMLGSTDTEQEDDEPFRRPVQRQEDLNALAESMAIQKDCGNFTGVTLDGENASEIQAGETFIIVPGNSEIQAPRLPEPNTDIQNILNNQSILFDITNLVIENKIKNMNKLASLSVQLEESLRGQSTVSLNETSSIEKESFSLKQIKNIQDLEEMEQLLCEHESRQKLLKLCSIVCSRGEGNGTNCAYRFLDIVFSREFLCQCSWSGCTRNDGVKISLKCFKNTLLFFFEMINQWDSTYTQEDNEKFFKNILKNATKRKAVKYERIPTKRCRTKGVKSAIVQRPDGDNGAMMVDGSGTQVINVCNNEYQNKHEIISGQPFIEVVNEENDVREKENNQSEDESLC